MQKVVDSVVRLIHSGMKVLRGDLDLTYDL